ncbi:heterokaryon incompatibility protein-domain-containing protein [Phyllosticta capitalensis]
MSDEYRYAKLATPSTIRVIKLEQQKVDDTITCIIRHVEQSEFEYHALSYVWGDPTPTRKIHLGNYGDQKSIFPLHENLCRFLDWAWDRQMFNRWIWTDRICLNQQDKEEMAQQIPRMGKIFGNAAHVLAWLNMSKQEGLNLKACLEGTTNPTHRLVGPILKNQYWNRVWIVQEVLKAKDAVAVVGDVEWPHCLVRDAQ